MYYYNVTSGLNHKIEKINLDNQDELNIYFKAIGKTFKTYSSEEEAYNDLIITRIDDCECENHLSDLAFNVLKFLLYSKILDSKYLYEFLKFNKVIYCQNEIDLSFSHGFFEKYFYIHERFGGQLCGGFIKSLDDINNIYSEMKNPNIFANIQILDLASFRLDSSGKPPSGKPLFDAYYLQEEVKYIRSMVPVPVKA